jgi:hypothetical protein
MIVDSLRYWVEQCTWTASASTWRRFSAAIESAT